MSLSDLKHSLRKYEFPACAKEALIKIEQVLAGRSAPSNKQMDLVMDIISEFVFYESDRRSGRRGGFLNSLQELQLIDVICEYLSGSINDTVKNTIFLSLFGGAESQRRLKILSIMASMAVSASSKSILLAVGLWLQQMGCSSSQSLQLAESIIRDHFYLTSNQVSLKSLANIAPQFVANFITAVTELYMHDVQGTIKMPPKNLLEVITSWVYSNPALCMSAQLNPAALPSGAIPMAAVTPLAGLIHWCSLAPLHIEEDSEIIDTPVPIKKMKLEGEKDSSIIKIVGAKTLTECDLYMKLHLGVLHSLRTGKRTQGPPTAVNAQHLIAMVAIVQSCAHKLKTSGVQLKTHTQLQDCLDRIGQAIQVALANGCVYGNVNHLLASLDTLPENRLLRVIIKIHQQNI